MAVFDNGQAPITQAVHTEDANVPRSAFNMSRVVNTQGIIGALMPIDVMETLPNEDYTISYDVLALTRNPLVRRLQNGMTIYIHTYWSPKRELWAGWDNYITKGRDGKTELKVPKLLPDYICDSSSGKTLNDEFIPNEIYSTLTPLAPSSYMGVPIGYYDTSVIGIKQFLPAHWKSDGSITTTKKINHAYGQTANDKTKWEINALPFVMYNKVFRDYYANKNLMNENSEWFPNVDTDFKLPYNSPTENNSEYYVQRMDGRAYTGDWANSVSALMDSEGIVYTPSFNSSYALLNVMHFRQFKGDYFTTANPFADMLRGDASESELNIVNGAIDGDSIIDALGVEHSGLGGWGEYSFGAELFGSQDQSTMKSGLKLFKSSTFGNLLESVENNPFNSEATNSITFTAPNNEALNPTNAIKKAIANAYSKIKIKTNAITLDALRKALVIEKFMRRNAATDGTYADIIQAQFGYRPNVKDEKPRYVGGTSQPITFNEVVQTSATNGTDYLGKTGSRGMSAGSGFVGKFHSDDYGYLMTIMSIVPDVYYENEGIDTMWTRTEQSREYFPILNNLEPQAILNKELVISGNPDDDNNIFGYAERFMDMKQRRNIITGFGALKGNSIFDEANFMKRTLGTTVNLNNKFVTMTPGNIDMTPFINSTEPPFDLMIGCNIDKVSPMPYSAKPSDLGLNY